MSGPQPSRESQPPAASESSLLAPDSSSENTINTSSREENDSASSEFWSGDEVSVYTSSLLSDVRNYPWENGRRYHAYGGDTYTLPNDEREKDRLDMTHHMLTLAIGEKLHLAPIGDNPQRILDIGTGTGIWAIEMGDKYPSAWILGNDLSPIQPNMVPPNVHFEVDDVEKRWMYNEPFDYIHSRAMSKSIADWPALVRQCYKFTKPGGWVEFADFDLQYYSEDGSLRQDHSLHRFVCDLLEASTIAGREPCPGPKLEGWIREAGFQNVTHRKFVLPVGPWPKDPDLQKIGAWNYMQLQEGLEGFCLRLFTKIFGWNTSDIHVMLAHVRNDIKDKSIHSQFDFHVVYAQKTDATKPGSPAGGRAHSF